MAALPLFDSHAHFSADSAADVVARARAAGLAGVAAIGADSRANEGALAAACAAPDFVRLALGFDYSTAVIASPLPAKGCARSTPPCPFGASPLSEGGVPSVMPPSERGVAQSAGGSTPCDGQESDVCASGISPDEAVQTLTKIRTTLPRPLSAIGEIGLDAHYGAPEDAPAQRALFERQVALAAEWGLPVVVHCREAEDDVLTVLRAVGSKALAGQGRLGVLHCFVGDAAFARAVLDLGMMVSISGIVTFRNADALRAVAKTIPADRLLVETDSPYLAPVPIRGKVNEPAFVGHTLRRLAEVRGESEEFLAAATCANARRLFDTPSGDRP